MFGKSLESLDKGISSLIVRIPYHNFSILPQLLERKVFITIAYFENNYSLSANLLRIVWKCYIVFSKIYASTNEVNGQTLIVSEFYQ